MKDKKLIFILSVSLLLVVLIGIFRPRELDWTPTFAASDKIPYGSYILFNSLPHLFGDSAVSLNAEQPYNLANSHHYKNSFLFVQTIFKPSPTNVHALLYLASIGNDIFVSSTLINGAFVDSLKLNQDVSIDLKRVIKVIDTDSVSCFNTNFSNPLLRTDSGYWYRKSPVSYYYNVDDTSFLNQGFKFNSPTKDVTVLGVDSRLNPTFICINYGAGRIFLHNNPFAFTNYYMLKSDNAEYAAKCLSYLRGKKIIWDEYYKFDEGSANQASLRFILSREPLRWAYYITLGSLLFFVLFNIKRKQRAIPFVETYGNTSLEFTRLVGALYYNQSDHKDIMIKKINYLLESIRNRYHLDTNETGNEFIRNLAAKSGIDSERIAHLMTLVYSARKKSWLSKHELMDLNNAIQYFKTHSQ